MTDLSSNSTQFPTQANNKPIAVWVFGILNVILGCCFLVLIVYSWGKIIADVFNKPESLTLSGKLFLFFFLINIGLEIWLIVLGIGLLKIKIWARNGSVLFAWINIVFIMITIVAIVASLITDWKDFPRIMRASVTLNNVLAVIRWIYMVLLLVFMKTAKVKQAFAAQPSKLSSAYS